MVLLYFSIFRDLMVFEYFKDLVLYGYYSGERKVFCFESVVCGVLDLE